MGFLCQMVAQGTSSQRELKAPFLSIIIMLFDLGAFEDQGSEWSVL